MPRQQKKQSHSKRRLAALRRAVADGIARLSPHSLAGQGYLQRLQREGVVELSDEQRRHLRALDRGTFEAERERLAAGGHSLAARGFIQRLQREGVEKLSSSQLKTVERLDAAHLELMSRFAEAA